jgi:replicative DNA helicase
MRPESVGAYERSFIGCALLHPEIVDDTAMTPADFSTPWAVSAWTAIRRLVLNGDPANCLTVHDQSPDLLVSELSAAEDDACSPLQVNFYAREIRTASHRRRVILACEDALRRLKEANGIDPLPEVVDMLGTALESAPILEQPKPLSQYVDQLVAELSARRERGRPGISSGFPALDSLTGGLRGGSLWVVAAETGVGKSIFAANLLLRARVPSVIFSLEMAGLEVAERMLAASCSISTLRLARGTVEPSEIALLPDHARILIDERPSPSVEEIALTARCLRRGEKIEIAVVDYLQIVRTERDERREAEVAAVARGLRSLARSLDIAVVALAQLNREGAIRDSAVIEHESHVVAVFERKKGQEEARLEVRKNRHGPQGLIALRLDKRTLHLSEAQPA